MRLVVRDLVHHYGQHQVLAGVDLEVSRGQSCAIVGPSGSGKTTLLALLGGLTRLQRGDVSVVDDHGNQARQDSSCAYVLQTMNFLSSRSALDNVMIGALGRGISSSQARPQAREALEELELGQAADRPAKELSGGELQRIVIARALVSGRPFILADEPTGQLDNRTSYKVFDMMLSAGSSRGLVVVTHDSEIASRCAVQYRLQDGALHRQ